MAQRRPFLDPDHPMFAKAWVRWVTTLAPIFWGIFELVSGDQTWGIVFLAAGLYAGFTLIYKR